MGVDEQFVGHREDRGQIRMGGERAIELPLELTEHRHLENLRFGEWHPLIAVRPPEAREAKCTDALSRVAEDADAARVSASQEIAGRFPASLLVEYCTQLSADGVLMVLSSETSDLQHLDVLQDCGIPVVLLDKTIDTVKHTTADGYSPFSLAAEI